ncbi:MAG: QueT transporter family protein [Clostridia bacterium]|nr:QueT transporter family protein [Clostridia bacterium]
MNKKTVFLTKSAVIGAIYTVLTLLCAVMGLAYNGIQFRFSEALCVLPLFSSAAVPGLTVGCIVANIFSSVNPLADALIGSLATLFAAMLTRKFRNVTIKGFPLLSMIFPVLFNAIFVGFEIAVFSGEASFWPVFFTNFLSVGLGEAAVIFTLGTALIVFLQKNDRIRNFISK